MIYEYSGVMIGWWDRVDSELQDIKQHADITVYKRVSEISNFSAAILNKGNKIRILHDLITNKTVLIQ